MCNLPSGRDRGRHKKAAYCDAIGRLLFRSAAGQATERVVLLRFRVKSKPPAPSIAAKAIRLLVSGAAAIVGV